MKPLRSVVPMIALLWFAVIALAQNRSPAHQFQQAIDLMETKGDYSAAIRLFEEVSKAPDRNLAARSLLYLGLCYEKLAKEKAQQAYQRLIREFADQRELVAEARVRLSALGQPGNPTNGSAMLVRRVWAGPGAGALGVPSPDGRYLSYTDWETGDLAVRVLATGEKHRLTNQGSWSDEFAVFSIISPDGTQVAYAWEGKDGHYDLRIARLDGRLEGRLDGSGPRVLYRNEEMLYIQPAEWSPDGKQILAIFRGKDGANRIVLASVADGSVRVLKTLDWRYPLKMSFSPDGRYIAYDFPRKEDSPERDIFLLAADGSREIPLVEHPANDFLLGWVPGAKKILFASDRTRTLDAWVLLVADGKPQGAPELVKQDMGRISPMGFTRKGSYYYGLLTDLQDVYVATLDRETGKLLDLPTRVNPRFVGANHWPEWSPDGKYLAYISQPTPGGAGGGPLALLILSLETKKQRELFPRLNYLSRLRWSPDGRFILVNGRDHNNRGGLFQINMDTGGVTAIVHSEPGQGYPRQADWSPDAKTVFYSHASGPILLRDLETGREREVYPGAVFALSPDGRWLAVPSEDRATKSAVLKIVAVAGGETRELLRVQEPGTLNLDLAWTPDGRYLLFTKTRSGLQGQTRELWRIPVEGGEPQQLGLAMEDLRAIRLHPDGQRIAFTAGHPKAEVWVMENFLPVLKAAR